MIFDARELEAMAEQFLSKEGATSFMELCRPAVRLDRVPAGSSRSRLGGEAILEPGTPWPRWGERPLGLVAVIDLADFSDYEIGLELPAAGLLNVFYDSDEQLAWGFDPDHRDGWAVIHTVNGELVAPPTRAPRHAAVELSPVQGLTPPDYSEDILAPLEQSEPDSLDALLDHIVETYAPDGPEHRLGGWPVLIQNPIFPECALVSSGRPMKTSKDWEQPEVAELAARADEWRLLLQIDSDDQAGWMWGDGGILYFAMRRSDAAAGRFDATWAVFQCH